MAEAHMTPDGWRRDKQDGHARRASWHDYRSPAIYLLTLSVVDRKPLLGRLIGETIDRSPLGQQISEEIERIPTYKDASSIEIYSYIVMPDHIHILMRVHDRLPKHLGSYLGWFKLQCADRYNGRPFGTPAPGCSVLGDVPPSSQPLFAPEYHDRLLTHRGQLANMAHYIQDNPRRLAIKRANPDLFRIHQQTPIAGVACTTLGNMFLNDNPLKAALHCSRTLTQAEINVLQDECLDKAASGTIFVSAAIAEGEKQICRALREAGYPLIILLSEGFPSPDSPHYKYYKPQGVYFEACAAGKLLLIEPSDELFERPEIEAKVYAKTGPIPHNTKRYRFVSLNAFAEEIAG